MNDPVDARLLAALAELGKAAVHELAAKVGMDPREVAYRLVALSGSGLPLLVALFPYTTLFRSRKSVV